MIVVSDTSGLNALIKIKRVELLFALYGDVVIPFAVRDELLAHHSQLPARVRVVAVQNSSYVDELSRDLHAGEAEAIALATEIAGSVLLIDEQEGRRVAEERGLTIVGVVGVLIVAVKRGLVPSLKQTLDELAAVNFYISEAIRAKALKIVGEA